MKLLSRAVFGIFLALLFAGLAQAGEAFLLPTSNRALFEPGGEERYFVGTAGRTWVSGTFGCVRSEGWQMHEGIDIRATARDRHGEPTDPITATADGTVAYVNRRPSLSNYGNYLVLRHVVEGIEIYSLYAHLAAIEDLKPGQSVKAGQRIATMGRTANTREGISKDRAHLHFELNLLVNERFSSWFRKANPKQRNDHGGWNGQNFLGLDPRLILLQQRAKGDKFSLLEFIQNQPEMARVTVRASTFPWIQRYPMLIKPNPAAPPQGIAGYELALNYNGVPFQIIPRTAAELTSRAKYRLVSVNEAEYRKNPGRRLVNNTRGRFELGNRGVTLLDVLTY
jgi:murein DD-endopeptidase MepM/ murein hydrolase activator NlpD